MKRRLACRYTRRITFGAILALASPGSGEDSRSAGVEATVGMGGLTGMEWRLVTLQMGDGAPMTPDAEWVPHSHSWTRGRRPAACASRAPAGATDSTVSTTKETMGGLWCRWALR